jgi:hypothetical protein
MKSFPEFQQFCKQKRCLRKTIVNWKCETLSKQETCYKKWIKTTEKRIKKTIEPDTEWVDTQNEVWKRDAGFIPKNKKVSKNEWKKYCRVWSCMTSDEQQFIEDNFKDDLYINENLDCSHYLGRGSHIEEKYKTDNIVLAGRYFSNLIDQYKDPVTKKNLTKSEWTAWWDRILNS